MRNRATADRQVGVWGAVGTALLHVGVVASMLFTWAHKLDFIDQSNPIVPVDLVTVADKTNVAPQPPQITPDKIVPPALPDMLEPPPQVVPEPKIEVAPAEEKKPVKAKVEKPKPEKFDINNIIASLNKHAPPSKSKAAGQAVKGVGPQSGMTADLATMLQSEIYRCWNPPVGAPHAERLIVSFVLLLNRDGSVAQPPQLTSESAGAAASDSYMRAAAEAGRRAIYTCAPYKLPPERYSQWQSVEITFDPRMLMGQ